jgi:hypothetical protein
VHSYSRMIIDVEDDKFGLPPFETLMKFKLVVTCCLDAHMLVDGLCSNNALATLESHVTCSIHPEWKQEPIQPHWTHLLIDEVKTIII